MGLDWDRSFKLGFHGDKICCLVAMVIEVFCHDQDTSVGFSPSWGDERKEASTRGQDLLCTLVYRFSTGLFLLPLDTNVNWMTGLDPDYIQIQRVGCLQRRETTCNAIWDAKVCCGNNTES